MEGLRSLLVFKCTERINIKLVPVLLLTPPSTLRSPKTRRFPLAYKERLYPTMPISDPDEELWTEVGEPEFDPEEEYINDLFLVNEIRW